MEAKKDSLLLFDCNKGQEDFVKLLQKHMETLRKACSSFCEAQRVLAELFELNRWRNSTGKTGVYIDVLEEQRDRFSQICAYRRSWKIAKQVKATDTQPPKTKEKKDRKPEPMSKAIITNSKEKIYKSYHVSPCNGNEFKVNHIKVHKNENMLREGCVSSLGLRKNMDKLFCPVLDLHQSKYKTGNSFFAEQNDSHLNLNNKRNRVFSEPKMLKKMAKENNLDSPQIIYSDMHSKQHSNKMPELKIVYKPVISKRKCSHLVHNSNDFIQNNDIQKPLSNISCIRSKLKELFKPVLSEYYEKLTYLQDCASTNADNISSYPNSPLCPSHLKKNELIKKIQSRRNYIIGNINSFGNMLPAKISINKNYKRVLKSRESSS